MHSLVIFKTPHCFCIPHRGLYTSPYLSEGGREIEGPPLLFGVFHKNCTCATDVHAIRTGLDRWTGDHYASPRWRETEAPGGTASRPVGAPDRSPFKETHRE